MTVKRKYTIIIFIAAVFVGFVLSTLLAYKYRHSLVEKERWFPYEKLDGSWEKSVVKYHQSKTKTNRFENVENQTFLTVPNHDSTMLTGQIYCANFRKDVVIENRAIIKEIRVGLTYPLGFTLLINDSVVNSSPNIFSLNLKDSITFSKNHLEQVENPIQWFSFSPKTLKGEKVNMQLNFYYLDSSLVKKEFDFQIEIKKEGYFLVSSFFKKSEKKSVSKLEIPRIYISTNGSEIPDEPKIKGHLKIFTKNSKKKDYNIRIEKRGHSSQNHNKVKNSYSIKLYDKKWKKKNTSLLGLKPDSDWVLYAPYFDKSLVRNALIFELGKISKSFCPSLKMCEVYINEQYKGVYYLIEKIEISKKRVNLSYKESKKGFLAHIGRYEPDSKEFGFFYQKINSGYSYLSVVYPKGKKLTTSDKSIIKEQLTQVDSLFKWDSKSNEIWNLVDLNSFVDFFIMNEITRNPDAYRLSTYMYNTNYLNPKSKLKMGPIWDFNLGFGNSILAPAYSGWAFDVGKETDLYLMVDWWKKSFRNNNEFRAMLKKKWSTYRTTSFSDQNISHLIDSLSQEGMVARKNNFATFKILDKQLWWNPYVGGNYENEIYYFKCWIENRLKWMDFVIDN